MQFHGPILALRCVAATIALAMAFVSRGVIAAPAPIVSLTCSPGDAYVLAGSQAGVQLYDWPTLKVSTDLIGASIGHVHDLAFSPDGRWLAVVGGRPAESGRLQIYNWSSRERVFDQTVHDDLIYAVSWCDDSRHVATASADHTICRVDLRANLSMVVAERESTAEALHPPLPLRGHSRAVFAVTYVDLQQLVSAGADRSLRLWGEDPQRPLRIFNQHTDTVNDLKLCPPQTSTSMRLLASASADRTVRFWQPTRGRLVRFVRLDAQPLAIAWSRDGRWLGAACDDGRLRVIDPQRADVVQQTLAVQGWAYAVAATSDAHFIVAGSAGKPIAIDFPRLPDTRTRATNDAGDE